MNKTLILTIGILLGASTAYFFLHQQNTVTAANTTQERKPLYWVAPMDPNYRRNEPGLSPMGMALVPVYEDVGGEPGVIRIAPNVIQNLGIKTSEVFKQPLLQNIRTVGKIQYNQSLMSHVHPRVSGWIKKLYHKSPGIEVKKGEPLFTLYSLELINAQEEYLLALASNRSQLINAAKNKLLALEIDLNTIQRIASNKKSEQHITFYAPQNGIISHLNTNEGEFVSPQNEIMSLANLSSVWLEIELTEQQMAWIVIGDNVEMTTSALPRMSFFGEVDYIYPYVNAKSNTAIARLTLANTNHQLKPNMIADIQVIPNQLNSVLVVPKSAVIRLGDSNRVVWAMNPGEYKSVNVELGQANEQYIEIISGLKAGDQIVTSAQFLLDSESSRTSDLSRYEVKPEAPTPSARTLGVIKAIEGDVITIHREAIDKWKRPAAIVEFKLDNFSKRMNIGDKIDFTFEIQAGEFVITAIHQVLNGAHHD
ncbi:MAG: efflux RND transporter periplasmic adaptor subunit [Xanthomonadales bacterium]|nr:efflux RND transporter periplasmic adaptor subunit [Xanthomonadales bacterium]